MSPLLPTFNSEAKALRVAFATPAPQENLSPFEIAKVFTGEVGVVPGNRLSVIPQKVTFEDCEAISSIEEAEDRIMNSIEPMELIIQDGDRGPTWIGEATPSLSGIFLVLNHQSNIIAARTRRGSGNEFFMSTALYEKLLEKVDSGLRPIPTEEKTIGRWTLKAIANGVMRIYVNDSFNEDEIFIAYVGSEDIDGPGAVIREGDSLGLYVLPNTSEALGNAADYIQRIKLKIIP